MSSIAVELGREREQIDDRADPHDGVAQGDRDGRADHLLDDRRVGGEARGDLGRPVLLEEGGGEAEQIALHRLADVGDHPLAEPGDEIEAAGGRDRQHPDDQQQIFEPAADIAAMRRRSPCR